MIPEVTTSGAAILGEATDNLVATEPSHLPRALASRAVVMHVLVVLGMLAVSVWLWSSVWVSGHPSSTMVCPCGDPALNLWFLEWTAWSITHLHNPLLTNAVYAGQGGANTLNTDSLFPGVLAAPITLTFGPVTAFNVLVVLLPVINGWSMLFMLRKMTSFWPGAIIGAVLYGFSPYVIGHVVFGHFNAGLLFFAPLLTWCVYDLIVTRRHRPVAIGVFLGLLTVIQFFTGPELLAMCALMSAFGAVVVVLVARRLVWERRKELATGLGVAAALAAVLLAYPAWFLVFGPRHIIGSPWPGIPVQGNNPNNIVEAGAYGATRAYSVVGGYFGPLPNDAYLGIPLVALLLVTALVWRRRRLAICAFVVGLIAWALSFGATGGTTTSGWYPWRLFDHLPLVSEIFPGRFSQFIFFAAGLLLAVSLDQLWARRQAVGEALGRGLRLEPRVTSTSFGILCCVAVLAALAPVAATYTAPFKIHSEPTAAWFLDIAPNLRHGTNVLAMPDPSSGDTQLMAWQALDHFGFTMPGGYALVPGRDGKHSNAVDPPGGAQGYLVTLSWGFPPLPTGSIYETRATRTALQDWGVQVVVVTSTNPNAPYVAGFLTAVLGRQPERQDGAWVWYGLGDNPAVGVASTTLFACELVPNQSPLGMTACVLKHAT